MRKLLSVVVLTSLVASCSTQRLNSAGKEESGTILRESAKQLMLLKQRTPAGVLPRSLDSAGNLVTCVPSHWVSGFYIGTLCYLYSALKDPQLLEEAATRAKLLDDQQYNTNTHDLGFMMNCSIGNLYKIQPTEERRRILINSAKSLATRFNPKVGCIRSWGKSDDTSQFRVIIDNMMNLELLMWAFRQTGDSALYKIAVTHANTTMRNHFRPNYSSYHLVIYDPATGAVRKKQTVQGYANESSWARGQSWGLYGYTMMYRETGDNRYLEQANQIAGFILSNPHLPDDKVPYWDYDAPGIPNASVYRDASAGAVMASALVELSGYVNGTLATKYRNVAKTIVSTLSSPAYRAAYGDNGGFLLKHSVGHLPGKSEIDKPLTYADYYYIEALERLKTGKP